MRFLFVILAALFCSACGSGGGANSNYETGDVTIINHCDGDVLVTYDKPADDFWDEMINDGPGAERDQVLIPAGRSETVLILFEGLDDASGDTPGEFYTSSVELQWNGKERTLEVWTPDNTIVVTPSLFPN